LRFSSIKLTKKPAKGDKPDHDSSRIKTSDPAKRGFDFEFLHSRYEQMLSIQLFDTLSLWEGSFAAQNNLDSCRFRGNCDASNTDRESALVYPDLMSPNKAGKLIFQNNIPMLCQLQLL
jgi:hypothetical protein